MGRNKLYAILGLACLTGYIWVFFSIYNHSNNLDFGICIFKRITTIPCPSCGSTRALLLLLHGDVLGSVLMNPFGILSAAILLIVPVWLVYDLVSKKQTLLNFYKKAEQTINIRWIAVLLIALVLANWMWNIYKHL
ncbi:MAG TPA: DUF2752 domain-containing protein [Flavobacterium sp.]|nr:DUF2752 domain-containing protein [Flavobacterium sp.]